MARIDPVATLLAAAMLALESLESYLRLAALPFVVSLGCGLWVALTSVPLPTDGAPPDVDFSRLGLNMLLAAVGLLAMIPPVTAWHRFVIFGHGRDTRWLRLQWRRAEWSYVWVGIKLGAILMLVGLPLGIGGALLVGQSGAIDPMSTEADTWLVLAGVMVALTAVGFLLALPAAALGQPVGLFAAFRLLKGNFWRLFSVELALMAPAMLLGLNDPTQAGDPALQIVISQVIHHALQYALLPLGAGVLSLAYLQAAGAPKTAEAMADP